MKKRYQAILIILTFLMSFPILSQQEGAFLDWVIQTDGTGNHLNNRVVTVDKDPSKNIIVCGGYNETINLNPLGEEVIFSSWENEETIPYMAKYDENGQLIWVNTFREPGLDIIGFNKLKTDMQGNIYTFVQLSGSGDFDPSDDVHIETSNGIEYYVASYDTDGNFRWVFKLEEQSTGGAVVQDIEVNDNTQTFTITGFFTNAVNFNPDSSNPIIYDTGDLLYRYIFLANYSIDGDLNWVKTFDNSRSTLGIVHDYYRVTSDEEGNIFLSGLFMDSLQLDPEGGDNWIYPLHSERESFISKYDKDGVFQWYTTVRGEGGIITNLAYNDGGVYMSGVAWENISFYTIFDIDSVLLEIEQGVSEIYFITRLRSESGDVDLILPLKGYNNILSNGYLLDFDSANSIYISGQFRGDDYIDFNPSPNKEYIITQNSHQQETFLAKYSKEGEFKWAFGMPGGNFTEGNGMVVLDHDLVIVGEYRGSPNVSAYGETPVIISTDFSPSINYHSFIAKYSQGFLSTLEEDISNTAIKVFPNPSNSTHTLTFTIPTYAKVNVDLYDIQGRKLKNVYNGPVTDGIFRQEIDVSQLEEGVYFYGIEYGGKHQMVRFVR